MNANEFVDLFGIRRRKSYLLVQRYRITGGWYCAVGAISSYPCNVRILTCVLGGVADGAAFGAAVGAV